MGLNFGRIYLFGMVWVIALIQEKIYANNTFRDIEKSYGQQQ